MNPCLVLRGCVSDIMLQNEVIKIHICHRSSRKYWIELKLYPLLIFKITKYALTNYPRVIIIMQTAEAAFPKTVKIFITFQNVINN